MQEAGDAIANSAKDLLTDISLEDKDRKDDLEDESRDDQSEIDCFAIVG